MRETRSQNRRTCADGPADGITLSTVNAARNRPKPRQRRKHQETPEPLPDGERVGPPRKANRQKKADKVRENI